VHRALTLPALMKHQRFRFWWKAPALPAL